MRGRRRDGRQWRRDEERRRRKLLNIPCSSWSGANLNIRVAAPKSQNLNTKLTAEHTKAQNLNDPQEDCLPTNYFKHIRGQRLIVPRLINYSPIIVIHPLKYLPLTTQSREWRWNSRVVHVQPSMGRISISLKESAKKTNEDDGLRFQETLFITSTKLLRIHKRSTFLFNVKFLIEIIAEIHIQERERNDRVFNGFVSLMNSTLMWTGGKSLYLTVGNLELVHSMPQQSVKIQTTTTLK